MMKKELKQSFISRKYIFYFTKQLLILRALTTLLVER